MLVVGLVSEVSPSLGAIFASAPTGTPLSLYISVNGKEGLERQKAFLEFTAGSIQGSYGLRQLVAGDTRYYTHYAYTSAPSVAEAMKSAETLYGSDSFAKFADKVSENRRVMNISILTNIVNYPAN